MTGLLRKQCTGAHRKGHVDASAVRRSYRPARYLAFPIALLAAVPGAWSDPLPDPEPRYGVEVTRSIMVPMRDGTRLSTDVYLPVGVERKLGAILIRLPYGKNRWYRPGRYKGAWIFAGQGFAVVVQDMRGTFQSEGRFRLNQDEKPDSADTLHWVTSQPWSNGRVGGYGCSYMAHVQHEMALTGHPGLRGLIPQAAFGADTGGAQELSNLFGWTLSRGTAIYLRPPPGSPDDFWARYGDLFDPSPKLPEIDPLPILNTLPVIDMMKKAQAPANDFEHFIKALSDAPRTEWEISDKLAGAVAPIPTLHMNSWYDAGAARTLELFRRARALEAAGNPVHHYALIGPGQHCVGFFLGIREHTENTVIGERGLGDARYDFWDLYIRWYRHLLGGEDNGVLDMPRLQYYLMGRNEWRAADAWPIPGTRFTRYYLHSGGGANSSVGDGTLTLSEPGDVPPDRFTYDPGFPVPTHGGQVCADCLPQGADSTGDYKVALPDGAFDQSHLEMRNDVLVYSTPPLTEPVEVTGPVRVVLYAASSAKDTDFTAKLVDAYPDGRAYNLTEGIVRARKRNPGVIEMLTPGAVTRFDIDLQVTGNWFAPGHRIRLEISSSNFPRFDRNLNTGGNNYDETEWVRARNEVHHSAAHPSHILLPIVPATNAADSDVD